MRRTRELLALVALTSVLAVTGCSQGELTAPSGAEQSGTAQSGTPNLDSARIDSVLSDVQETLTAGDAEMSTDDLKARVADPALRLRAAQYALARAKGATATPLDLTAQTVTVTNAASWPRAIVDIAQADEGDLPIVYVLRQDGPRSGYKLVNWTRLLGGTSLTTISADQGSPYVGADATGFVMTPAQAVSAYVDMLNGQTAGDDHFTTDEFAQTYLDEAASINQSVQAAGSVTAEAEAPDDDSGISGVVLKDGSALVAASFTYTHTYARTVKDSTMKLGGAAAQLNEGDDSVIGTVTTHYLVTVLIQIPDQDTGGKASVVGAERAIESVSRDDTKKPEGE